MKQTERKGTLRNIKWQTLIGGSSGYWRFVIRSSNPRTGFICVKYIFTYFRNEPNLRKGIWVISGTMLAYEKLPKIAIESSLIFQPILVFILLQKNQVLRTDHFKLHHPTLCRASNAKRWMQAMEATIVRDQPTVQNQSAILTQFLIVHFLPIAIVLKKHRETKQWLIQNERKTINK